MLLKTTTDEMEIIRTALTEYTRTLRDRSRAFCTGYSDTGIDLCVRRMQVEQLILKLEEQPPVRPIRMPLVAVPGRSRDNETAAIYRDAA